MLKFKNITGVRVDLNRPAELGGRIVEKDEVVNVDGKLVTSRPKPKDGEPEPAPIPEDAYLVDVNGEERAWPHALWELQDDDKAHKPAAKADKEN